MTKKTETPKIDFKSLVGQIKSVIGSGTHEPEPVDGDQLGQQMQEISQLSKRLGEHQAELTQGLYDLNEKVNLLYESLEHFRQLHAGDKSSAASNADSSHASQSDSDKD